MTVSKYEAAFEIPDPAERADALVEVMEQTAPSESVLAQMLNDEYDVIRAEALDYIITARFRIDEAHLRLLAAAEESVIVRGRVNFCAAVLKFNDPVFDVYGDSLKNLSDYDKVWKIASDYLRNKNLANFALLSSYLFSESYDTTGTALDILEEFTCGLHRRLAMSLLDIILEFKDNSKINLDRVRVVLDSMRAEVIPVTRSQVYAELRDSKLRQFLDSN